MEKSSHLICRTNTLVRQLFTTNWVQETNRTFSEWAEWGPNAMLTQLTNSKKKKKIACGYFNPTQEQNHFLGGCEVPECVFIIILTLAVRELDQIHMHKEGWSNHSPICLQWRNMIGSTFNMLPRRSPTEPYQEIYGDCLWPNSFFFAMCMDHLLWDRNMKLI